MKSYLSLVIDFLVPSIVAGGVTKGSKRPLTCQTTLLFLLLIIFVLSGCTSNSRGESEILRDLRANERVYHRSKMVKSSYFFYPSTMRMINIDNLSNWNEAINDVRRLGILSMSADNFNDEKQKEVLEDLKTKENFSIYVEMDDQYSNFKLLGRKNGSEAVLIYNDSTANYVVHLLGKINYIKMMKLSADLRDMENPGAGITFLKEAMESDRKRTVRNRQRQKRKAAERLKKDSIEAAQALETAIIE